jgi:hypothetical protein
MAYNISVNWFETEKVIIKIVARIFVTETKYYLGVIDMDINRAYKKVYGRNPNIENPKTLSEKLLYLKKHYKNPLQTICADKYYVCEYVRLCGYSEILRKYYAIYWHAKDISFDSLPDKFFIRCNNRSGLNFIVDKKNTNEKTLKRIFGLLIKQNYYHCTKEWPYKNIVPCIICEEILENNDGTSLTDYKFYCFAGKPVYFMVSYGEFEHKVKNIKFDISGNPIDNLFKEKSSLNADEIELPKNLDKMIEIASVLCKPFPHVRVDLYNVNGKIYFGEMTFYSNAGVVNIYSKEYDEEISNLIDLNRYSQEMI